MKKLLKIKEWLKRKEKIKALEENAIKSPLLDNSMDIRPFEGVPIGKIFYLEARYSEGEIVTGELPFG